MSKAVTASAASALGISQPLAFLSIVVPAGQTIPVSVAGNYVYVEGIAYTTGSLMAITPLPPTLRADTQNTSIPLVESWRGYEFSTPFNYVQLTNPNNYALKLSLFVGYGRVQRDRGRRVRTAYANALGVVGPYVANQYVGAGPLVFNYASSPSTERARIKQATLWLTNPQIAAADFRLFLFGTNVLGIAYANKDSFMAMPYTSNMHAGTIDFPKAITGAAGSPVAICDVANIDLEIYASTTPDGYNFQLFGLLVTNDAYTPTAPASATVSLVLEFD